MKDYFILCKKLHKMINFNNHFIIKIIIIIVIIKIIIIRLEAILKMVTKQHSLKIILVMAQLIMKMAINMKANLKMVCAKVKVNTPMLIKITMKEILLIIINMVQANQSTQYKRMRILVKKQVVVNILAILKKVKNKVRGYILIQIRIYIKVFGKIVKSMVKELMYIIQQELSYKVNGMKGKYSQVNGYFLMVIIMKGNLNIISRQAKANGNSSMEIRYKDLINKL